MFETYLNDERAYPYLDLSAGNKLWESIQSNFHRYRYIVKAISNSHIGSIKNTFLLDNIEELLNLKKKKDIKILNIHLLYSGCTEGWKLKEVSEIWEAIEPDFNYEQTSYIFILKNNSRHVKSSFSTPEEMLLNKKLLHKK